MADGIRTRIQPGTEFSGGGFLPDATVSVGCEIILPNSLAIMLGWRTPNRRRCSIYFVPGSNFSTGSLIPVQPWITAGGLRSIRQKIKSGRRPAPTSIRTAYRAGHPGEPRNAPIALSVQAIIPFYPPLSSKIVNFHGASKNRPRNRFKIQNRIQSEVSISASGMARSSISPRMA